MFSIQKVEVIVFGIKLQQFSRDDCKIQEDIIATDYQLLIVVKCNSSNRPSPLLNFVLCFEHWLSFVPTFNPAWSNLRTIFNAKLIAAKGFVFGNFVFLERIKKKKKLAKISQENNFSFYRSWKIMDHITCSSSSVINILSKLLFILSEEFF